MWATDGGDDQSWRSCDPLTAPFAAADAAAAAAAVVAAAAAAADAAAAAAALAAAAAAAVALRCQLRVCRRAGPVRRRARAPCRPQGLGSGW